MLAIWRRFNADLKLNNMLTKVFIRVNRFFFLSGFSFTGTDDSQDCRGREGTIAYSTLPLPSAHEHSDIYLQLCMWGDYHVFLIATLMLLDKIYHLIELSFDWLIDWWCNVCLFTWWIDSRLILVNRLERFI